MNKFGPTPRCPGCADVTKGISVKHAHNDECRNRITKSLMDEDAQRVESYFDRSSSRRGQSPGRFEFRICDGRDGCADSEEGKQSRKDRQRVEPEYPCRRCVLDGPAVQGLSTAVTAPCRHSKEWWCRQRCRRTGGTPLKTWRSVS